jgi:hypothetical protein
MLEAIGLASKQACSFWVATTGFPANPTYGIDAKVPMQSKRRGLCVAIRRIAAVVCRLLVPVP